jgi:hypothetical protein
MLDARRSVPTLPLPSAGVGRLALFTFAVSAGCGEPTHRDAMDVPGVYLDVKDAHADAPLLDASVPDMRDAARSLVRVELDPDGSFCNLYGVPPSPDPVK